MATQTVASGAPRPDVTAPRNRKRPKPGVPPGERSLVASPSTWVVWAGTAAFFIFLIGILVSVMVDLSLIHI